MAGFSIILLLTPFFALSMAMYVFVVLILLALAVYFLYAYTLESLSVMRILRGAGKKGAVLAWVPFYKQYLLGKIAGCPKLGAAVALDYLAAAVLCLLPNVAERYLVYIALAILALLVLAFVLKSMLYHRIYQLAAPKRYDLFTIFGVVTLGILRPAFLFALKNKVHKTEENNL